MRFMWVTRCMGKYDSTNAARYACADYAGRLQPPWRAAKTRRHRPASPRPVVAGIRPAARPHVLARAANIARSRLDLELAERLARAAVDADSDPATKLLLAYVLFMREKGAESEQVFSTIDPHDLPATSFVSPAILRSANLLWVLRRPEQSWEVIDDALRRAKSGRTDHLRTFRAVQLVLAGKPAETSK